MKRTIALLLVLLGSGVIAAAAAAQTPSDEQIVSARAAMLQSEANFYQMAAQKLQAQLGETAQKSAEQERWWHHCVADPACVGWASNAPAAAPKQ